MAPARPGTTAARLPWLYLQYRHQRGNAEHHQRRAVSNTDCYIGNGNGSAGTVTVDGTGSTWTNSGTLYVGYDCGSGTLNITNGGAVTVTALRPLSPVPGHGDDQLRPPTAER